MKKLKWLIEWIINTETEYDILIHFMYSVSNQKSAEINFTNYFSKKEIKFNKLF